MRLLLFGGFQNLVVQKIQSSAKHNPFNTIFITLTKGLPYRFLFRRPTRDSDPRAAASRAGRILLYATKLDSLGWNEMASIGKVEHAPKLSIRIRFGYLEKREIRRVGRW